MKYYQFGNEKIFLYYKIFLSLVISCDFCKSYISFIFYVIASIAYLIYRERILRFVIIISQNKPVPPGPSPPDLLQNNLITLVPPVLYDTPQWGHNFGDVVQQPPKVASPGDTVSAIFVSISTHNSCPRKRFKDFPLSIK